MSFHRDIQTILIPTGEARPLMLLLLEHEEGLSTAQVLMGEADNLPQDRKLALIGKAQRVANGEPIQYVLGDTLFCGLQIGVEPGVLIPRPETEELVRWAAIYLKEMESPLRILDLCTGSGCIALALKEQFPQAEIHAVELSETALTIACRNAQRLKLDVQFHQADVLSEPPLFRNKLERGYSMLISNPPYICQCEAQQMESNVLEYEPHMALFVPNNDPLRFYRAITFHGMHMLKDGGRIFLELNPIYAAEAAELFRSSGFSDVTICQDSFGKSRMLTALWNHDAKQ